MDSLGLLLVLVVVIFIYKLPRLGGIRFSRPSNNRYDDDVSDAISRTLMSRKDYYRKVYLKSDAWHRKRFVVLRRDNWSCVYCGARATQVHHKRYAKRNIGKEPIDWLVSVCKSCHDSLHR